MAAPDEQRRAERADDAADTEGCGQGGDPAVVGAQQVEGDDHDEDVERPAHDRLGEAEAEHETQVAVRGDHADALDRRPSVTRRAELGTAGGASEVMPSSGRTDRTVTAAMTAKAADGLATASTIPASTGPANVATASSTPRTTLALVSSVVSVHRSGRSAEWTGRKTVIAAVTTMARA